MKQGFFSDRQAGLKCHSTLLVFTEFFDFFAQSLIKIGPGIDSVSHVHAYQNLSAIALQIYISIDPVLTSESLAGEKLLSKFGGFDIAVKEAVGFSFSTDAFGYF